MDKKIAVVIPAHKEELSAEETISFLRCKEILAGYDVFLLHPQELNINRYVTLYPAILSKPVPGEWLSSVEAYNTMKRSAAFYHLFEAYDYLLTYELDAYIFSDDWNKAHCFQYDYTGAPWFAGYSEQSTEIMGVGNSGFSMRNIKSCLSVLARLEKAKKYWKPFRKLKLDKMFRFTLLLRLFDKEWNVKGNNYYFIPLLSDEHINEDIFWGSAVPNVLAFKIASIEDSIKFSFEIKPSELFKKNGFQLPIGCHAWQKYEPEFWKPYIAEF